MESDGNVLSSGKKETVLRSNKKKIKRDATYDMIVHYEVIQAKEDNAAVFRIRNAQDEIIAEQEMPKDATETESGTYLNTEYGMDSIRIQFTRREAKLELRALKPLHSKSEEAVR